MGKFSLNVGYFDTNCSFLVDDLQDVNQLYGAMKAAVEFGLRLISVEVL